MKLAIICPPQHFHFALRSQVHLLLTHVMDDPEIGRGYTERYAMLDRKAHYKILDNGAHENDTPTTIEGTLSAARRLRGVAEVVMPDVQQDAEATCKAIVEATDWLLTDWGIDCYTESCSPNLMYVPQGSSKAEWIGCLKAILDQHKRLLAPGIYPLVPVIGIAKKHALIEGMSIGDCCRWTERLSEGMAPIHLLGWPENTSILEISEYCQMVRSIDTAKPISLAMQEVDAVNDADWPSGRPDRFFQTRMSPTQVLIANRNIDKFKQVVERAL